MPAKQLVTVMQGDVAVITFQEARILDERNVQRVAKELNKLVDKEYRVKMILNFQNVRYLSSAVIGKIVALYKKLKAENGELKICCVRPEIMAIFRVTNLDRIIDIKPTLEHVIQEFKIWRPPRKKSGKKAGGLWSLFKK